jgi:hypothetical protein
MEDRPRTSPEGPPTDFGWGDHRRGEPADAPPPPPPPPGGVPDLSAVFVLLDAVRRAAPAELQERITTLIREALLTLRALIDWYLERLERRPRETRVEDIPID